MKDSLILKMLIAVFICLGLGFLSGYITTGAIEGWYATINKPGFNPPNWIFGPVWTLLYLLMGVSLYLVWVSKKKDNFAFIIFGVQLFLNSLWSLLFFGLQNPLLAFLEINLLWIAIAVTMFKFYKISKPAFYLLIPYILWVSFAYVLNLAIALLN